MLSIHACIMLRVFFFKTLIDYIDSEDYVKNLYIRTQP